jgi:hypothetical protein
MRYTECRLARIADEMLSEIEQRTVHFPSELRRDRRRDRSSARAAFPNPVHQRHDGHRRRHGDEHPAALISGENLHRAHQAARQPELEQRAAVSLRERAPTFHRAVNSQFARELKEIYKSGAGRCVCARRGKKAQSTRGGRTLYVTSIPYS